MLTSTTLTGHIRTVTRRLRLRPIAPAKCPEWTVAGLLGSPTVDEIAAEVGQPSDLRTIHYKLLKAAALHDVHTPQGKSLLNAAQIVDSLHATWIWNRDPDAAYAARQCLHALGAAGPDDGFYLHAGRWELARQWARHLSLLPSRETSQPPWATTL